MLTEDQEKYLETIPEDKGVIVQDFNLAAKKTAREITDRIKAAGIKSEVWNISSSELEIAGQNDIDINVLSSPDKYRGELPILEKLFGKPKQTEKLPMKWEFEQGGFDIELHLTDATTPTFQEHLRVFTELKYNPELRHRYEEIKRSCSGKSFREYMCKKYEFFNEILESSKGRSAAVGDLDDFGK